MTTQDSIAETPDIIAALRLELEKRTRERDLWRVRFNTVVADLDTGTTLIGVHCNPEIEDALDEVDTPLEVPCSGQS